MIEKNIFFAPILNVSKKLVDVIVLNRQDFKNTKFKSSDKGKKFQ